MPGDTARGKEKGGGLLRQTTLLKFLTGKKLNGYIYMCKVPWVRADTRPLQSRRDEG